MTLNLWSLLLIASASQCIFLIVYFFSKPAKNKVATRLLISLLGVILLMNVGNFWYAARLYLEYPYMAGFARGFTLLIGPIVYLYARSIIQPNFRLKAKDSLHFLGYGFALAMIMFRPGQQSLEKSIEMISTFLMDGLPATPWVIFRFVFYALFMVTYLLLSTYVLKQARQKTSDKYQVSNLSRVKWIKKINYFVAVIVVVILYDIINAAITGYYSISTNYLLTLVYSALVYTISFHSIKINQEINPDFKTKYQPTTKTLTQSEAIKEKMTDYLSNKKPFKDSSFKQADLANALNLPPHQLTAFLNQEMGTSTMGTKFLMN